MHEAATLSLIVLALAMLRRALLADPAADPDPEQDVRDREEDDPD